MQKTTTKTSRKLILNVQISILILGQMECS